MSTLLERVAAKAKEQEVKTLAAKLAIKDALEASQFNKGEWALLQALKIISYTQLDAMIENATDAQIELIAMEAAKSNQSIELVIDKLLTMRGKYKKANKKAELSDFVVLQSKAGMYALRTKDSADCCFIPRKIVDMLLSIDAMPVEGEYKKGDTLLWKAELATRNA